MQFHDSPAIPIPVSMHNKVLAQMTFLCCDSMLIQICECPLIVILFDGGSSDSLIERRAIPEGVVLTQSKRNHITTTVLESFHSSLSVRVCQIELPEFSNDGKIDTLDCPVLDSVVCLLSWNEGWWTITSKIRIIKNIKTIYLITFSASIILSPLIIKFGKCYYFFFWKYHMQKYFEQNRFNRRKIKNT